MPLFNNTRKIALNRNVNLCIVGGLFLALLARFSFLEGEIGLGLGFAFFALIMIVGPLIGMPICYIFDPEGVSLKYIFFPQERYLWENIYFIQVADPISDGGRKAIFMRDFKIQGDVEGKERRYMHGRICKTWRTKRLITKYWDGTIEGYWHDEVQAVKKWWHKRTHKAPEQAKHYKTDEIVAMERQARASIREWIELFVAQAKQYDLNVHTQYLYITEDYEEHRSRPQAPHTYTASIRIFPTGETDEDKMIIFYTDMIRVRLGKNAYRGVVNPQAEEDLKLAFTDIITQIRQKGYASYFQEIN